MVQHMWTSFWGPDLGFVLAALLFFVVCLVPAVAGAVLIARSER